jgi:hypothetical protein
MECGIDKDVVYKLAGVLADLGAAKGVIAARCLAGLSRLLKWQRRPTSSCGVQTNSPPDSAK